MSTQNVFLSLFKAPTGTVAERPFETILMGVANTFNVVSGKAEALLGLSKEESIMGIAGRVALGLEE